jgi:hypothetical protein
MTTGGNTTMFVQFRKISRLILTIGIYSFVVSCASLPKDVERPESHALQNTDDTRIGREVSSLIKQHPGQSGFYLLNKGMEAFTARIAIIEHAERSLDVQYYIWHDDLTGKVLQSRLLHAGNRGVRVRLLLDDLDWILQAKRKRFTRSILIPISKSGYLTLLPIATCALWILRRT